MIEVFQRSSSPTLNSIRKEKGRERREVTCKKETIPPNNIFVLFIRFCSPMCLYVSVWKKNEEHCEAHKLQIKKKSHRLFCTEWASGWVLFQTRHGLFLLQIVSALNTFALERDESRQAGGGTVQLDSWEELQCTFCSWLRGNEATAAAKSPFRSISRRGFAPPPLCPCTELALY